MTESLLEGMPTDGAAGIAVAARPIRVLLVDDHQVVRAGLRALLNLEPDMEVVGEAGTGEAALERIGAVRPDVVVLDLEMPGMDGLEASREISRLHPATQILVLTSHSEEESLLAVLEAGAHGYVQKTNAHTDLTSAIRVTARGEVFLYPSAIKRLLNGYRAAHEKGAVNPLEDLSERESQVLALAAEGYNSFDIGKKLFLSPKTVDTYRSRMMRKLGLDSRAALVHFALEMGLLNADR
jgi:two-component system, NarL family, response regulator NreC